MKNNRIKIKFIFLIILILIIPIFIYKFSLNFYDGIGNYAVSASVDGLQNPNLEINKDLNNIVEPLAPIVTHIPTPSVVKSVYASAWTMGSAKYRDKIITLVDDTEINSIVIDVKDSTGRISFEVTNPELLKMKTTEKRISDIKALTKLLHDKNIYIIARISVFQDPYLTKIRPDLAITKKSDGGVWKDRKGLSFLDPSKEEVWKYIVAISKEAYDVGFDEINFDYIRYPSDGNIKDINYRIKEGGSRSDNLETFFKYLNSEVKKENNIPMSADIFGLTTEVDKGDDMGIGQVWEKAYPHFDFICPMIYPSHYPPNTHNFKNPAQHPYEIIKFALEGAISKTKLLTNADMNKIRPWLQDFDMGAKYTKDLVRAQIKATYDVGLTSFMLWDPRNEYTRDALEKNQ